MEMSAKKPTNYQALLRNEHLLTLLTSAKRAGLAIDFETMLAGAGFPVPGRVSAVAGAGGATVFEQFSEKLPDEWLLLLAQAREVGLPLDYAAILSAPPAGFPLDALTNRRDESK